MSAGVSRRLEHRQRSVLESRQHRAGIVDPDRLDLAREIVLPFLDEGLRHRGDFRDRAVQPQRGVDAMREQIARHAAAGDLHIEPPEPFAALRQLLRDRPVLKELRAVVEDATQTALVQELFEHGDRGHAPVVVPDRVRHAGRFDSRDHRLGLFCVPPERLLAHDDLSRLCRGDRDLVMRVVRARDVDQVDVLPLDELPPVALDSFVSPIAREALRPVRIPRADRLEHRPERQVEEARRLMERIGVRAPHEAVTDETDVQILHISLSFPASAFRFQLPASGFPLRILSTDSPVPRCDCDDK